MISTTTIYNAFQQYKDLGLDPLPIPYENGRPTKGPKSTGWNTRAADGDYSENEFADPCNIGILLGGPRHLTDIDCDAPQAVAVSGDVFEHLMEQTGNTMIFGRQSKPRSHFVFFTDTSLSTEQVHDPSDGEMIVEYRCVTHDGERSLQTVVPPSLNYNPETGVIEDVRFEADSAAVPAFVPSKRIYERFRGIAAIALLAKHFPAKSECHNTILALAGVFARCGMEEQKAISIITLAYRHSAGFNGDIHKAEADVRSVYKELSRESASHLRTAPDRRFRRRSSCIAIAMVPTSS